MGDEIKLYYMLDLYLPVFMFIADEPYPYPCEFDIFIKKNKKHMTRYLIMNTLMNLRCTSLSHLFVGHWCLALVIRLRFGCIKRNLLRSWDSKYK